MLEGSLSTMSLADLLQWADSISTSGLLVLERGSNLFWFRIQGRYVVLAQRADVLHAGPRVGGGPEEGIELLEPSTLALERLFDQFLDAGERFRFDPDGEPPEPGLPLRVSLQKLVMEGLRILDEWPRLRDQYPADQARLRAVAMPITDEQTSPTHAALQRCAERELTLSQARTVLGLSRPALLRTVEDLRRLGCVEVEAAPNGIDLTTQLMDQASALIRARQFDEVQHVLRVLLTTDPSSSRVKQLLREAEVLHLQALYTELSKDAVVHVGNPPTAAAWLSRHEQSLLDRINGRWDVATLVMASKEREIETLKALRRMWRQGLIQLHR